MQKLQSWCNIPSGTYNRPGLAAMADALSEAFTPLGDLQRIDLAPTTEIGKDGAEMTIHLGQLLAVTCRPEAKTRVLLAIHYDTVYAVDDPFDSVTVRPDGVWNGPGVADAKGGIAVMLAALTLLEQSPAAKNVGWEVLLNPDEEIGSPGSAPLLVEAAKRNHFGLLFEPAWPDGMLVGERKGSGNFTVVVRGKAAHAGRDFHHGRSAIIALSKLIATVADRAAAHEPPLTLNCGNVSGGAAVNIVPDLAIGRFNARAYLGDEMSIVQQLLEAAVHETNQTDGIAATLHGGFTSPPKPVTPAAETLFQLVKRAGSSMGLELAWRASGGTCDGNRLAAAGLPLVDTMGPVGGHLHSREEYLLPESIAQRAELTTRVLIELATNR